LRTRSSRAASDFAHPSRSAPNCFPMRSPPPTTPTPRAWPQRQSSASCGGPGATSTCGAGPSTPPRGSSWNAPCASTRRPVGAHCIERSAESLWMQRRIGDTIGCTSRPRAGEYAREPQGGPRCPEVPRDKRDRPTWSNRSDAAAGDRRGSTVSEQPGRGHLEYHRRQRSGGARPGGALSR
jgi:hypothetical protein